MTGGKQVVSESWRNLISVGAKPIAITNCLNFGNPEKEKNMGEFVECVNGISEAAKYLNFPVVSGNVSFYNETKDKGIKPTPSIGGIGLIEDYKNMITMNLKKEDNIILVIGKTEGYLDQSIFSRTVLLEKKGPPPEVNLFNEKNNGETILKLINKKLILSCHDVSVGGILTAVSKMCIKGKKGVKINPQINLLNKFSYFFAEDQGRYIIEIEKKNLDLVKKLLKENSVHFDEFGVVTKEKLQFKDELNISIVDLSKKYKSWLEDYMAN